jgi:hypothetical protein
MSSTANGRTLLAAEITQPRVGAWRADLEIDSEEPLTGAVTIDIEGTEFRATVVPGRSGAHGGRVRARVVGGAGGLSKVLPARNYAGGNVRLEVVLRDILRATGETLSPRSDAAVLSRQLGKWHRSEEAASHALVALLDAARATWRVERDGTVWVGTETWPEATLEHVLLDEDWAAGVITIAPERPELEPGTTFLGQRIEQVVHTLEPNALRTEAHLGSAASALNRFLGHIRRRINYSRPYPARVSRQHADGTLELVPDDAIMRGSGLDRVPIRYPAPGMSLKVTPGSRCIFEFEGGDPARPIVTAWSTGAITELKVVPNGLPAARQGDMTATTLQLVPAISPSGSPIPNTWTIFAAQPSLVPGTGGPGTFYGAVVSGNPIVKQ